jgi:hypothetical protein
MAAKIKTSITLSQDAMDEVEALSANDTHRYSVSSVIEALIHDAYAKRADHLKRIVPIREAKRTVGWAAYYGDHFVTQVDGAGNKDKAQYVLDAFVREELSK